VVVLVVFQMVLVVDQVVLAVLVVDRLVD